MATTATGANEARTGAAATRKPLEASLSLLPRWAQVWRTGADPSVTVARLALGAMILPHGLQKTLGWFGGFGLAGTMEFFTETMGIPWILALAAIAAESLGGAALLLGVGGRIAAAGVCVVMVVAAFTTHVQNGFFMNWSGAQAGEGWEFHMLAAALALVVTIRGSGAVSLDRALTKRLS